MKPRVYATAQAEGGTFRLELGQGDNGYYYTLDVNHPAFETNHQHESGGDHNAFRALQRKAIALAWYAHDKKLIDQPTLVAFNDGALSLGLADD